MSINNFFIADPYNDKHIELFNKFEEKHNNKNKPITTYLSGIKKAYENKEDYQKIERDNNELNLIVFTLCDDQNSIRDYCYIKGEKDIKVCELFFAHLSEVRKVRPIMDKVSNYVLNSLNMELLMVSVAKEEVVLNNQLTNHGYEDIGELNGKIAFIKGKSKTDVLDKVI